MEQWIINQEINTNLIKWWSVNGNKNSKITIIGTSCCYDEMGSFNEENYLNEKPHNSLATYAMTKKMLLQGIISCQLQKTYMELLYSLNALWNRLQNHK